MSTYEVQTVRSVDGFDDCEWDRFVDESPQGNIFCHSWWLDAVCPKGFEILIVRKAGRIVAGMPMVHSRKLGYETINLPQLTKTLGALLEPPARHSYQKLLSREMTLLREVVKAIPNVDYFSMNFHHTFTNWLPFRWSGYSQTTAYTYVIQDLSDPDVIWKGLKGNIRTDIRKARRQVQVVQDMGFEKFCDLNDMAFFRQGRTCPYSRTFLRRLDTACEAHNARKMFFAVDAKGRVHAACYLVWTENTAYYLMAGADPDLRNSGAGSLLLWEAIEFSRTVAKTFDFEGSVIERIEQFFRSFGAVQTQYFTITKADLRAKAWLMLRPYAGRLARAFRLRR